MNGVNDDAVMNGVNDDAVMNNGVNDDRCKVTTDRSAEHGVIHQCSVLDHISRIIS
jgi:hypothetical protein